MKFILELNRIRDRVKKYAHSRAVGEGAGVHAKTVRRWVTEICRDGKFVVPDRAYVKRLTLSFIDDEDIRESCQENIDERVCLPSEEGAKSFLGCRLSEVRFQARKPRVLCRVVF